MTTRFGTVPEYPGCVSGVFQRQPIRPVIAPRLRLSRFAPNARALVPRGVSRTLCKHMIVPFGDPHPCLVRDRHLAIGKCVEHRRSKFVHQLRTILDGEEGDIAVAALIGEPSVDSEHQRDSGAGPWSYSSATVSNDAITSFIDMASTCLDPKPFGWSDPPRWNCTNCK
jgi:hypothetical protein